ncbi:hypothetical protein ACFYXL_22810 [Streptomyces tsukubensis]|uniref:hypothetical protein n=1 Tax=Streptomyces tsukubensis TaxID=83656 RepID=UPI0036BED45B
MTTTPLPTPFHQVTARLPLVRRSHLVYPSFRARIEELRVCAERSARPGPLASRIDAACATWNLSALIASDSGLPEMAADLCVRQLRLFQAAWPVDGDVAIAALQPMVNLIRLTARSGAPDIAYRQLAGLHRAVHHGGTVTLHGQHIDLTRFATPATVGHIQPWLRFLMVDDGTRLLASTGHWAEAAEHAFTYDPEPHRLLDSRQSRIVSAWHANDPDTTHALLDEARITEPWEDAVLQLLRHGTETLSGRTRVGLFAAAVVSAQTAVESTEPHTRMFRVRLARIVRALAPASGQNLAKPVCRAVLDDTQRAGDAFAAREILRSPVPIADDRQRQNLESLVRNGNLGQGTIPATDLTAMGNALNIAETSLTDCLAQQEH